MKYALSIAVLLLMGLQAIALDLTGTVKDKASMQPLYDAEITIEEDGKVVEQTVSMFDGTFKLKIKKNRLYTIKVNAEGYFEEKLKFSTENVDEMPPFIVLMNKQGYLLKGSLYSIVNGNQLSVPNANVYLLDQQSGEQQSYSTGPGGDYQFRIKPGVNYRLSFPAEEPLYNGYLPTAEEYLSTVGMTKPMQIVRDLQTNGIVPATSMIPEEVVEIQEPETPEIEEPEVVEVETPQTPVVEEPELVEEVETPEPPASEITAEDVTEENDWMENNPPDQAEIEEINSMNEQPKGNKGDKMKPMPLPNIDPKQVKIEKEAVKIYTPPQAEQKEPILNLPDQWEEQQQKKQLQQEVEEEESAIPVEPEGIAELEEPAEVPEPIEHYEEFEETYDYQLYFDDEAPEEVETIEVYVEAEEAAEEATEEVIIVEEPEAAIEEVDAAAMEAEDAVDAVDEESAEAVEEAPTMIEETAAEPTVEEAAEAAEEAEEMVEVVVEEVTEEAEVVMEEEIAETETTIEEAAEEVVSEEASPEPAAVEPFTPVVANNIYYAPGKAYLSTPAKAYIKGLAQELMENPDKTLRIAAYSDTDKEWAIEEYISQMRLEIVMEEILQYGVAFQQLNVSAVGNNFLANDCEHGKDCSPEEHQENRRVEFSWD